MRARATSDVVLVLAPLGRDAELACDLLAAEGFAARPCRAPADLDAARFEELSAVVLTEEAMTPAALSALAEHLDAEPPWSTLPVILLLDPEDRRMAGEQPDERVLAGRPGTLLLQRPVHSASLVSAVRTAVLARRRQFELRDELAAREEAETRARLLADEMKHRVKNAFAVASSVASQTFQDADTLDAARDAFSDRMSAMSRAQDLLASTHGSADFGELVAVVVEPYRRERDGSQFTIDGPEVRVPARTATALAMGLHELATNAAKYGALSVPSGQVEIRWTVERDAGGPTLLLVRWQESGGPPVVPAERRGFGSRLVQQALAYDLGHPADLAFNPEGVICTIRATISDQDSG